MDLSQNQGGSLISRDAAQLALLLALAGEDSIIGAVNPLNRA
jgi:hypothetical protein